MDNQNPNQEPNLPNTQNPAVTQTPIPKSEPQSAQAPKPSSKLKYTLIILGILEIPLSVIYLLYMLPYLLEYKIINVPLEPIYYFTLFILLISLFTAITQIIIGVSSLHLKLGRTKTVMIIILGIFSSGLLPVLNPFSFVSSLYSVTYRLNHPPTTMISPTKIPLKLIAIPQVDKSGWKIYNDKYISLKYPPSWTIKFSTPSANQENLEKFVKIQDIELSGKEGKVSVHWLDVWNAPVCTSEPNLWREIRVDNSVLSVCYKNEVGKETWQDLNKIFNSFGFQINAESNTSLEAERNIILGIISTFKTSPIFTEIKL
nr:hypothetical protein [Candidatus Levybacteria bacterium]